MKSILSTPILELKQKAKLIFAKNKEISCPAFPEEKIIFNSKGLNHLFYEGSMKARPIKEAETRISLLPRALRVLKKMTFWQEERTIHHKNKIIHYWSLEAVIDERRIKIIIRQLGNGKKCFWSVIPSWRKVDGKIVNARSDLSIQ